MQRDDQTGHVTYHSYILAVAQRLLLEASSRPARTDERKSVHVEYVQVSVPRLPDIHLRLAFRRGRTPQVVTCYKRFQNGCPLCRHAHIVSCLRCSVNNRYLGRYVSPSLPMSGLTVGTSTSVFVNARHCALLWLEFRDMGLQLAGVDTVFKNNGCKQPPLLPDRVRTWPFLSPAWIPTCMALTMHEVSQNMSKCLPPAPFTLVHMLSTYQSLHSSPTSERSERQDQPIKSRKVHSRTAKNLYSLIHRVQHGRHTLESSAIRTDRATGTFA